ncbi:peptidase S8/S53 domain-containing protein [Morchella snyderi]|nr:peptidase S8/S53 domain-containing protein [Morchella snyderi]
MYFDATYIRLAILLTNLGLGTAKNLHLKPRDYGSRDYYALHLTPGISPNDIAEQVGLEHEGLIGELDDHHLFSAPRGKDDIVSVYLEKRRRLQKRGSGAGAITKMDASATILFAEKQKLKRLVKRSSIPPRHQEPNPKTRQSEEEAGSPTGGLNIQEVVKALDIKDPIFLEQWHLHNSREYGHDVNVTGVWMEGITGVNATVAIVDDGLDMYSEDLKANYFAPGSYDFNDHTAEPKPRLSDDRHGTRCAGEIAAVKNNVCGVGVAWDAKVAGIRILSKQISDVDEAVAMNYAYQDNQIYSCSWGPPDDGQAMDAPGILIRRAMIKGVQSGRQGRGSIFVFASGNGAANEDNCNFDGYTNSIYSITTGAIDRTGKHPYYSELCSAQMVVTYSSGSGDAIHTTDVGVNACYANHGGTSAAAPLAAGIFALVLSVRPDLSWRDLQYLVLDTAVPVNTEDPDWETTVIGKQFNHKYGYGKLDAWAIVQAAKNFKSVKPQAWFKSPVLAINHAIPEGQKGLQTEIKITADDLKKANLERLEHVTVTMNAKHGRRGEMSVDLISPSGLVSHIATQRKYDKSKEGYKDWTFMSVKHWGEDGVGTWTVIIKDGMENDVTGTLVDWRITLWGEAIDAAKAKLLPLPGVNEAEDNDVASSPISTLTPAVKTTRLPTSTPTTPAMPTENPTDHVTRPVNEKPGNEDTPTATITESPAVATNVLSEGEAVDEGINQNASYLPSFLPTFGVSAKTQVWIYGAFAVIAVFVGVVASYLFIQRKKQRASKDGMDYEFAVLNDEDELEGTGPGEHGRGAMVGGRRKARDLYDAFGASDDEEELFSDSDEKGYDNARDDYGDEEAHGVDEGRRVGDREKLLGRGDR